MQNLIDKLSFLKIRIIEFLKYDLVFSPPEANLRRNLDSIKRGNYSERTKNILIANEYHQVSIQLGVQIQDNPKIVKLIRHYDDLKTKYLNLVYSN